LWENFTSLTNANISGREPGRQMCSATKLPASLMFHSRGCYDRS